MKAYTADSELAALIKEAAEAGHPLRVRTEGGIYELDVRSTEQEDIWKDYDAVAVGEALQATFGIMKGVDVDTWVEEYRAARV